MDRQIVAYRHRFGKKITNADKEIVCVSCRLDGDREIVLHSENGQRVKAGALSCATCGQKIRVGGPS